MGGLVAWSCVVTGCVAGGVCMEGGWLQLIAELADICKYLGGGS